ncbi:MAG: twin-arginine translocation pathway signal [Rhizobiales bacterium]|nr:twin-arginine translocation pathway signal [Hyphomicrobiales bacterium]
MTDHGTHNGRLRPLVLAVALLAAGAGLGGCASVGDGFASGAFVDPAKYELYDCKQLEAERKSLATRTAELQRLMNKADTGVAGPVVAEVAYRNDYVTVRASAKLADEEWRKNKCVETAPPAAAPPPPAAANPAGAHARGRSGGAVH